MHVLIVPMYSKQEINGDSGYVLCAHMVRGMLEVAPDWRFVFVFPDGKSGYTYEPDGLFDLPNVIRVPQRINPRKHSNAVSFDGGWYDALFREMGFDVVWCNLVESAGSIKHSGEGSYMPNSWPVVVAAHNYIIHKTLPYAFEAMEHTAVAQILGASLAHHHVFNSHYSRQMFIDTASRYLRADYLDEVLERSSIIHLGMIDDQLPYTENDNAPPVIIYNHRLQAYKNWKTTFDVLFDLWNEGLRFKVIYTNNTAENTRPLAAYPFVDIRINPTRAEYIRAIQCGDINVTNSQHETFCISAIESMALGQVLVAPNGLTFPELTGREKTGYPFLFNSIDEEKNIIRRLIGDADLRRKWARAMSEHVRREFGVRLWAERYRDLFVRLQPDMNITEAVAAAFGSVPAGKHSTMDFFRQVNKYRDANGRQPLSNQSLSSTKLIRAARKLGYTVSIEGREQVVFKPH